MIVYTNCNLLHYYLRGKSSCRKHNIHSRQPLQNFKQSLYIWPKCWLSFKQLGPGRDIQLLGISSISKLFTYSTTVAMSKQRCNEKVQPKNVLFFKRKGILQAQQGRLISSYIFVDSRSTWVILLAVPVIRILFLLFISYKFVNGFLAITFFITCYF